MLIEMKITGLAVDPKTNMPIVILQDLENKHSLPIWIGILEASAIATELEQIVLSRPMTHDLIKTLLERLEVRLERISIVELRDNTYYANLHLRIREQELVLDARPSDSLALALRTGASIWVESQVLENCGRYQISVEPGDPSETSKEKFNELLQRLSPKDFGKYKM